MILPNVQPPRSRLRQGFDRQAGHGIVHRILYQRLVPQKASSCGSVGSRSRQLDEAFQLPDAGGVAHFPEGLGFDLADPLAGDLELAADFFKRAAVAVLEAEALFEDLALAFG